MRENYSVAPSERNVAFIAYADMGIFAPPSSQSTAELVNQEVLNDRIMLRDSIMLPLD